MNDWFLWKGDRCTSHGIHVLDQPDITYAQERVEYTDVPGRSGSLATTEGTDVYSDITLTCNCIMKNLLDINDIGAYLTGAGTVEFANRPGGYYKARINNQISLTKLLRGHPHMKFAVTWRCEPFWYLRNCNDVTITGAAGGARLTNIGTVYSRPLIAIHQTGSAADRVCEITVNGVLYHIDLPSDGGSVYLDSETGQAYGLEDGVKTNLNANVTGDDLPILNVGKNTITYDGDQSSIVISPRWRYI